MFQMTQKVNIHTEETKMKATTESRKKKTKEDAFNVERRTSRKPSPTSITSWGTNYRKFQASVCVCVCKDKEDQLKKCHTHDQGLAGQGPLAPSVPQAPETGNQTTKEIEKNNSISDSESETGNTSKKTRTMKKEFVSPTVLGGSSQRTTLLKEPALYIPFFFLKFSFLYNGSGNNFN